MHGALDVSKSHTIFSSAKMPKHFNTADTDIQHGNIVAIKEYVRSVRCI